jgi:hypothetical protein
MCQLQNEGIHEIRRMSESGDRQNISTNMMTGLARQRHANHRQSTPGDHLKNVPRQSVRRPKAIGTKIGRFCGYIAFFYHITMCFAF